MKTRIKFTLFEREGPGIAKNGLTNLRQKCDRQRTNSASLCWHLGLIIVSSGFKWLGQPLLHLLLAKAYIAYIIGKLHFGPITILSVLALPKSWILYCIILSVSLTVLLRSPCIYSDAATHYLTPRDLWNHGAGLCALIISMSLMPTNHCHLHDTIVFYFHLCMEPRLLKYLLKASVHFGSEFAASLSWAAISSSYFSEFELLIGGIFSLGRFLILPMMRMRFLF